MKVREVVRLLERDGWIQTSQRGSHRQFEHPSKPGKVAVPGNPGAEVPKGTLRSLSRQARLELV
jgi:predicted RNA binding protein YcfA (HicA-like mRNA interferase family)